MATLVGNRRKDPQPLNPGQQGKLIERIEAMYQICRANTVKEVSWSVRRQLGGLGRLGYSLVFCISALSLQPTHASFLVLGQMLRLRRPKGSSLLLGSNRPPGLQG